MRGSQAAAGVTQERLAVVIEREQGGRLPSLPGVSASVGWTEGLKLPLQCFQEAESFIYFMNWQDRWEGRGDGFFLPERSEDKVQDLSLEMDRWTDTQ